MADAQSPKANSADSLIDGESQKLKGVATQKLKSTEARYIELLEEKIARLEAEAKLSRPEGAGDTAKVILYPMILRQCLAMKCSRYFLKISVTSDLCSNFNLLISRRVKTKARTTRRRIAQATEIVRKVKQTGRLRKSRGHAFGT